MGSTAPLLLLLSLSACQDPGTKAPDTEPGLDTGDSQPETTCLESDSWYSGLTATPASVETVVLLNWTLLQEGESHLAFTDANGLRQERSAGSGPKALAHMIGLEQGTEYSYQLFLRRAGERELCSPIQTVSTGSLPSGLPALQAEIIEPARAFGGFLVTSIVTDGAAFPVILDARGEPVWAREHTLTMGHGVTRSTLNPDRAAISLAEALPLTPFTGELYSISAQGEQSLARSWPVGVDFLVHPDGTFAVLSREDLTFVGPSGEAQVWTVDSIVELHPLKGSSRVVWQVIDDFHPEDPHYARTQQESTDWAHVNSLSFDAEQDLYLVTAEIPKAVMAIDRASGELRWLVNASPELPHALELAAAGTTRLEEMLERPHSARLLNGGLLVFNRSAANDLSSCARVVELGLDEHAREVDLLDTIEPEECIYADFLGEAERLPGGNTQVIWSTIGRIDEYSPEHELLFRVELVPEKVISFFGFGERVDSLYPGGAWSGRAGERPEE